jgi:glycosyltransferase involved in cell wall biosynthesis
MKIAFDAKRALNNSTGLGNHARILLNALLRDFPENEYLLFSPKAKDEWVQQLNGKFKTFFPETGIEKTLHPLWRSLTINQQLEKEDVDVYHGLSNEIPLRNGKSSYRSVVTIHDLIFLKHIEQYPFADRQIYKLKTKYAAKHSDKIIAVSNETKNDLMEFYKVPEEKIVVIHPSVDPLFQTANSLQDDQIRSRYSLPNKFILNIGSFFPRKNQRTLIEAFDLIKGKVEEDLVLVGKDGNLKQEIEELIEKKKLADRVKILSNVANNDLPSVYRTASVFVFPSLYEGFGAPVLEALFSGVPVITTKGGAMQEAGGNDSLYANPMNAEEIADAMLLVLKNDDLRKRMIENGLLHSQAMTDSSFAEKTMKVYKALG